MCRSNGFFHFYMAKCAYPKNRAPHLDFVHSISIGRAICPELHKKLKSISEMLLNCENGYLRRSRTYKCVQNVQIIFRKSGLQFIDYQIQQCKEYVYLITIKSLLKIVFFITCFAKEVLNNFCFLSAS